MTSLVEREQPGDTLPPTSSDDERATAFEHLVIARGESRARWDMLMALLAPQEGRGL